MYKKRDRVIPRAISPRSGQITVFMILGLLVLFVFIFVFALSAGVKKGQLQDVQEKVLTKSFKKEALRIFVEDCLTDELEKGLVLIGRQGRLWNDQPGGTRNFEEDISGVAVGNDRVFYAETKDPYLEFANAYPCSNESSPPEFCQYTYPNTKVGFGSLELRTSTIQSDLRRFLLNRTVWCVSEYTKNNISSSAVLESQEAAIDLGIHDSGIDVKVNYPLKLHLGAEEFFHLSQFDFFYPTRFKALLDTAVSFPLRMDWQYIDFNYNKTTLENLSFTYGNENEVQGGNCLPFKNYFFCKQALFSEQYASLGIDMSRQTLANGDDIFVFKSSSILNSPELYTYQFARQNRPPALDYVHRLACPAAGYDYLVIKDDQELGMINFTFSGLDPDEDSLNYAVYQETIGYKQGKNFVQSAVQQGTPSTYRAYANDEHGLSDWQDVRVLVDRPLELSASLFLDYQFWNKEESIFESYEDIFQGKKTYLVSKEDPSFLRLVFPENSLAPPASYWQEVSLLYSNKDEAGTENFAYKIPEGLQISGNQGCFSFPGGISKSADCTLAGYENDISGWSQLLSPAKPFPHFREETEKGELNLSFSAHYCALFDKSKSAVVKIVVNDCVPHRNPEHPWAYPNHNLKYDNFNFNALQGDYLGEEEINPFEATHSCCIGVAENPNDWQIADADYPKACFINPEPGCYGQVLRKDAVPSADGQYSAKDYYTSSFEGYLPKQKGFVLEVQQQFCSGNRGNICDGKFKNDLKNGKLICGTPGENDCSPNIHDLCANKDAFGFVEAGWCHGTLGCSAFCQEPVSYSGSATEIKSFDINAIAKDEEALNEEDISFHCGCAAQGQICDNNFDGKFDGLCQADLSCL